VNFFKFLSVITILIMNFRSFYIMNILFKWFKILNVIYSSVLMSSEKK